ncbi:MAG: NAD(P)H-dependent oxidoreductase, partial [Bacteroidota bacterium]
ANQLTDVQVNLIDLNDFEMPIYSIDKEQANGIPALANQFNELIKESDAILISFAEHNGSFTAAYKNIYDWVSRIGKSVWEEKPMILLATSPGGRGGKLVLETAEKIYGFGNPNLLGTFSLPSFNSNFDSEKGILDAELKENFNNLLERFNHHLNQ